MNIPSFYSLQQCDKITVDNNTMPYVKSYYSCLHRLIGEGYSEDFQFSPKGIKSSISQKEYGPTEYTILNMFRFEGSENAEDNVLMYMLETGDGSKGTLITQQEEGLYQKLFATKTN